jgi:uncharacterized protein (UPF0333 family)
MTRALLLLAAVLAAAPTGASAGSVSGTLSITVSPPALALILNPSNATETCTVAGGTLVSTASTTGGDGNAITFSMTGNTTDFLINSSTGVVTVAVAGVALADCGKTYANVVTATQP